MASIASGNPLVMRIISSSVMIANRAGKIVKDVLSKGQLGIVQKGHNDLQTEADRSAQLCIVSSLAKQFPNITIIGEETLDNEEVVNEDWIISDYEPNIFKQKVPAEYAGVKEEDIVIWVDPLDGTSEYTQGLLSHVTVLIGISVNGKAVGGVIHQPYFNYQTYKNKEDIGRTIWGLIGLGAFGIDQVLPPTGQRIITTTRSHLTDAVQMTIDAMQPTNVLRVGGAGHKVLMLIEGKAHAYLFASPGCKKWDTCAPEAILKCVGGDLTDVHGSSLQYHRNVKHMNSGGVLATSKAADLKWYLDRVPKEVQSQLSP